MNDEYIIKPIAYIHNDLNTKFGVPRQSGLAESLLSEIIFEPEYRVSDALRGITDFSHIWLIWSFSEARRSDWSPTVRPPRLGGNERVGVFATRSPYRPNSLALSCVKLLRIEHREGKGEILIVSGADLMNGTPIYDIKPYLPYADCKSDAVGGFARDGGKTLGVIDEDGELDKLSPEKRNALTELLARDPRPQYHDDCERVYGMSYGEFEVKFRVDGENVVVISVEKIQKM
ncbi:MAG: tRNA (N6-threonylcarbamoyladenosine(37)-N6)-methyltransferase TrmO [Ruminococcaceae bacterium]|nr:tRNA (N6-threonylcarbamoyladenosine(37)-N6)-methyltransferase TrmO [Oscillospiraceae bacterium]